MKYLFLSLFLFGFTLSAADLTGKWAGTYNVTVTEGDAMQGTVVMILTQSGSEVTGTVGPDEQQQTKISKGVIDGDKITFESQTEGPLMKFDLRLEGDRLRGEARGAADGTEIQVKLDLAKAPQG